MYQWWWPVSDLSICSSSHQVVASNHFSEGGATQLDYDLSKVLVSLLAEFFVDIPSVHLLEMYVQLNHS